MLAGLQAQSGLAPRSHRSRHTNGALALAAAVRVVAGVHDNAADGRTHAHVAHTARLAQANVLMVGVAHGADGRLRAQRQLAHFAGGETHLSEAVFLTHQLSAHAGGANHLAAAAGLDLKVVDQGANGNVRQRQRVAGLDVGVLGGNHRVAHLQVQRGQNVALLAIRVVQQRDEGAAVRIVLDSRNLRRNLQLVALEVDHAILDLVAAALMTNGDLALLITAGVLLEVLAQALFRSRLGDFLVGQHRHKAPGGRSRLIESNSHGSLSSLLYWAMPSKNLMGLESFFRVT